MDGGRGREREIKLEREKNKECEGGSVKDWCCHGGGCLDQKEKRT